MSVRGQYDALLDELGEQGMPISAEMSLRRQHQSLYCTVMKRAWEDAGESLSDPGDVRQHYFPDRGVVVIEFDE